MDILEEDGKKSLNLPDFPYKMSKMKQIAAFLILISVKLGAQSYEPIQKAEKYINKGEYRCAIKQLEEAVAADPSNEYIHYRLGYAYKMVNDYNNAIEHYEAASGIMKDSMRYHFDMYHLYSSANLSAFAKQSFINYVHLCPSCVKSDLLPGVNSNKLMYRRPVKDPMLMGYETKYAEYYPYIIDDDQIQHLNVSINKEYPTHGTQVKNYLTKIYSNKDYRFYRENTYTQIHKKHGEKYGPFSLNKELNKIYITRWDDKKERLMIYYSHRESDKDLAWKRYYPIEIEGDETTTNNIHPMLTKDEKHLIFASDKTGGLGGYDLWIGDIVEDTRLTNIKNLGTYINTPGDELYPSTFNEEVLFFASDGHYGFGGLDLYAGVKSGIKYKKTFNLGNRFNSSYDDYSLFYNQKKNIGFFTSNRYLSMNDSQAMDRIYTQTFDRANTKIDVIDQYNRGVAGAAIELPSEKINSKTDEGGKAEIAVNPLGYKSLKVSADNYSSKEMTIEPFDNRVTVKLQKNEPTNKVTILLVSHPHEQPASNVFYNLTNLKDNQRYCGTTNMDGYAEIPVFEKDAYLLEVPHYAFKKETLFHIDKENVFQVYSDMPTTTESKAKATTTTTNTNNIDEVITENYTIYYDNSQWMLTPAFNKQIQNTVNILNQNPGYKVQLTSHTDCQGDAKLNMELSKRRLEEAKKIFFSRGVSESQMVGRYVGETEPKNNCHCDQYDNYSCPSNEMRQNRRTEVRILK